ncbi:ABC transporter permease [Rubritalea tangerina]|uniref:ABC transporter permease n=1 Tax=Rubritalea tangerina TaxID=430798 RepID=A0ABW4ZBZ8_9BACT
MRDSLYLAWRNLCYYRAKSIILIFSVALVLFLPSGLKLVVEEGGRVLKARSESTPLLLGAKGSALELTMNALYFGREAPEAVRYGEAEKVMEGGLAEAIPLYTRFEVQGLPIVGTSLDYMGFRKLRLREGRLFATLGECLLGSEAAEELGVGVGDSVVSSPESVFDLAGVYPLKMKVVGVLAKSGTADDMGVFTDIKTTWVIQGLAHGHMDMASAEAAPTVLKKEEGKIVANAAVKTYNEVTASNVHQFHFHGSQDEFPISALIVVPNDKKAETLLRGRYVGKNQFVQMVQPRVIMEELLETVASVQAFVMIGLMVAGGAAGMTMVLVFMLSVELRKREILTMQRIGAERGKVGALIGLEVSMILLAGGVLAAACTASLVVYGPKLIQQLIS